jgi:hypothetical protein
MADENKQPSGFVRFLRGFLRLILSLIIGILIGAGLYFGFQYLYERVAIPIEQNTAVIQALDTRVNQQWTLLNEKNIEIEDRVSALENDQQLISDQISEILVQIEQNAADLDAYQIKHSDLIENLEEIDESISDLIEQDKVFSSQNEDFQDTIDSMDVDKKIQPIQQEVAIFKILLQINRSRLFLLENNLGLAQDELMLAQEMLATLIDITTPAQEEEFLLWEARLDLAISHLPDNPILANDDLEILWTMMANGFNGTNETRSLDASEETDEVEEEQEATATETEAPSSSTPTPTPRP